MANVLPVLPAANIPLVPQQPATGPQYPTLDEIETAANGPPVRFSWKETNGTNLAQAPGGWTDLTVASPNVRNRKHICFIFTRHSSGPDDKRDQRSFAANALIAIRLHQILRIGGQRLDGNTLLVLMTITRSADMHMTAYPTGPPTLHNFCGFIEIMEGIAAAYSNASEKPYIWLVSRSMSSLTCKIPHGWTGFLNRPLFRPLHQQLQVIYQVPAPRFPPNEQDLKSPNIPWIHDTVLPIKWQSVPLLTLVGPLAGQAAWIVGLKMWLQEEDDARTGVMPFDMADWVKGTRGHGRLQVE